LTHFDKGKRIMRIWKWLTAALSLIAVASVSLGQDSPKGEAGKTIVFTYKKANDKPLGLHAHFPDDWKPGDQRPALVVFFGGGWTKGTPTQFEPQATYLAKRGMVCCRAEYTLGKGPDVCVADARDAMRWMRGQAKALGIDPDRIVSAGGSAGGHLAACLGCCDDESDRESKFSSRSNAMILFNPVTDMVQIAKGGKFGLDEKKAQTINPIGHYAKNAPPAILFFGTSDSLIEQGKAFVAKGRELGNRVEMFTADQQPHGFFNRSPWQERTLREAEQFLVSIGYLKGESTLKVPESKLPELKKYGVEK
jgi:acetyl esterase/lipase